MAEEFLIDGRHYDMPDLGTLSIGECKVFTRLTGLTLEKVLMGMQDGSMTFLDLCTDNAGFTPAIVEIAYRREHPDLPDDEIEEVIDKTNRLEMFMSFFNTEEEEESPPSSGATSAPPNESPNGSSNSMPTNEPSKSTSGQSSTPSSEKPDGDPANTGTTESDTWPTLVPSKLVS